VKELAKKIALEESKSESNSSPKLAAASKSSAALREQIRKAKAERRSMGKQNEGPASDEFAVPGFDPNKHADPFNQGPKDNRSVMTRRVDAARREGRLNIAAMGLKEIPEEVLKMYDFEFNKDSTIAWAETVDLARFIAADNEIETISDEAFPDTDPDSLGQDDDNKGSQFGGIEVLDLHGNVLFDVPLGLRRLQNLTSLNLVSWLHSTVERISSDMPQSRNRLMNDALETIAQITSLRELKIADNLLTGELTFIEQLQNLEVLEVQDNKLSALPDELRDLVKLRVLNVSNNNLMDLPMTELSQLPLVELLASKNKLTGALFTAAGTTMPRLQNLDVSINSLTTLYDGTAGPELPCLHTLNISFNSITALPTLSTWEALATIYAEDNKITALPAGFAESTSLRHVNFTGNDFSKLDERIAFMDGLEVFKIAANPLRERKFLTMRTEDLKRDLRARIGPIGFAE
jgi:Leucine-rich repeat (LRR) protein